MELYCPHENGGRTGYLHARCTREVAISRKTVKFREGGEEAPVLGDGGKSEDDVFKNKVTYFGTFRRDIRIGLFDDDCNMCRYVALVPYFYDSLCSAALDSTATRRSAISTATGRGMLI